MGGLAEQDGGLCAEGEEMNKRLTELYEQAFGYLPAPIGEPELEKFAALVAAAEREACAQIADEAKALRLGEIIRARGNE